MIIITSKVEICQVQRSLKWKDFIIINLSQVLKWNGTYMEIPNSNRQILLCQGIIFHYLQAT
jgi:hypothetical protein